MRIVSAGLVVACIALWLAISASHWHFFSLPLFMFLWVFNGSGQSAVWTGTVAIMGNWFSKENRGSIFGFWSANSSAGNIIGSQVAGLMMSHHCSWETIMLTAVIGLFVAAVLFFIFVTDKPRDTSATEATSMLASTDSSSSIHGADNTVSLSEAWQIEG